MTNQSGNNTCETCAGEGVIHERVRYEWQRTPTGARSKVEVARHHIAPLTPPMNYYNDEFQYPAWVVETGECACRVLQRQATSLTKSVSQDGVPKDKYDQYTFDDFNDQSKAREAALEFVQNDMHVTIDGVSRPGLLFVGATGVHKTCLTYLIYRELLSQGVVGAWWLAAKLIKAEQDTYDDKYTGDREAFIKACRTRLLILDDLGTKRPSGEVLEITPDKQDIMFRLFEHREAKGLPTIGTTNLKKQELYDHFGDRVTSRILGLMHVIPMTGKDSRVHPFDRS